MVKTAWWLVGWPATQQPLPARREETSAWARLRTENTFKQKTPNPPFYFITPKRNRNVKANDLKTYKKPLVNRFIKNHKN
jgi:hypothetical protein